MNICYKSIVRTTKRLRSSAEIIDEVNLCVVIPPAKVKQNGIDSPVEDHPISTSVVCEGLTECRKA